MTARDVTIGEPPRSRSVRRFPARVSSKPSFGEPLSGREIEVLASVAMGLESAAVGRRLFLSEKTVKTHLDRLFRKLGATNRAHAVALAYRSGVFDMEFPEVCPSPAHIAPERLTSDAR